MTQEVAMFEALIVGVAFAVIGRIVQNEFEVRRLRREIKSKECLLDLMAAQRSESESKRSNVVPIRQGTRTA